MTWDWSGNHCRLCGKAKLRHSASPNMLDICASCDRVRCGNCKKYVLDGNALRCPDCREPIGLHRDKR